MLIAIRITQDDPQNSKATPPWQEGLFRHHTSGRAALLRQYPPLIVSFIHVQPFATTTAPGTTSQANMSEDNTI